MPFLLQCYWLSQSRKVATTTTNLENPSDQDWDQPRPVQTTLLDLQVAIPPPLHSQAGQAMTTPVPHQGTPDQITPADPTKATLVLAARGLSLDTQVRGLHTRGKDLQDHLIPDKDHQGRHTLGKDLVVHLATTRVNQAGLLILDKEIVVLLREYLDKPSQIIQNKITLASLIIVLAALGMTLVLMKMATILLYQAPQTLITQS